MDKNRHERVKVKRQGSGRRAVGWLRWVGRGGFGIGAARNARERGGND